MVHQHTFEHHVGLLIFPQGIWTEKDKDRIINSIEIKRKTEIDSEFWFYNSFILSSFLRKNYSPDCRVCIAIKDHFRELPRDKDNIFYINGPYLGPHLGNREENYSYLKIMISSLFHNEKIKKVFFCYFNSIKDLGFKDMKMNDKNFSNESFSEALRSERIILKDFLNLCQNLNIKSGTVHEIMRDYSK